MAKITQTEKEIYREIQALLDKDLKKMSRENLFAVYGYISAYFEMGLLTDQHLKDLLKRLPLSAEEMDEILL